MVSLYCVTDAHLFFSQITFLRKHRNEYVKHVYVQYPVSYIASCIKAISEEMFCNL